MSSGLLRYNVYLNLHSILACPFISLTSKCICEIFSSVYCCYCFISTYTSVLVLYFRLWIRCPLVLPTSCPFWKYRALLWPILNRRYLSKPCTSLIKRYCLYLVISYISSTLGTHKLALPTRSLHTSTQKTRLSRIAKPISIS